MMDPFGGSGVFLISAGRTDSDARKYADSLSQSEIGNISQFDN